LKVQFILEKTGEPDKFSIDFGDKSAPVDFDGGPIEHVYTRPFGNDKTFIATVTLSGPGSCVAKASVPVEVPGRCPKITDLIIKDKAHSDYQQTVSFEVTLADEVRPDTFVWNFGDGSPIIATTETKIEHTFNKGEKEQTFSVSVKAVGPDDCKSAIEKDVTIDKGLVCPIITDLRFKFDKADKGKIKVHAEIIFDHDAPTQIDVDWGDKTIDKNVNTTVATHEYDQPDGVYKIVTVTVFLLGPKDCKTKLSEQIKIPAKGCPELKAVKVTVNNTSANEQAVTAKADTVGDFESYVFDWGDGTIDPPSTNATATHVYARADQDKTFTISVNATGPGPCKGNASTKHSVARKEKIVPPPPPPPEDPGLCKYLPYVVAFLSALTLGHLAMLITALNTAGTDTGLAWGASIVSLVLLVVAIILWFRRCKPTRCDWLAIGWTTFFSACIPIFNSLSCAGEEPLVPTLIGLVIGGVFGFLWFRSCSPTSRSKVFLTYFILLVVAGLITGLLTTAAVMNC
ncbi:MAG: PKD domain-containing protein, partial [Bacteroidota bacterium]